jgi:hypothetical protein
MNSMIQVVNQHAKLLDTISHELGQRVRKIEVGEMFDILSHSFPYDKILIKQGLDSSVPLPRSSYISDQLLKHHVKVNSLYSE